MRARVRWRKDREGWEVVVAATGRKPVRKWYGAGDEARERAEAAAQAVEQQAAVGARFMAGSKAAPIRTDEAVRGWLVSYRETLTRSYEGLARGLIENHLIPFFGPRDLRSLRERDALAFAAGRSPAVVRNALTILRRVAQLHVQDGLLERNHFAGVGRIVSKLERRQATRVRRVDAWTAAELGKLLDLAERFEPAIYGPALLAAYTGCRRGEALALRWDAVDFTGGRIEIREALVRGHAVTPKSGRERVVPMDVGGPRLRAMLERLAAERRRREAWTAPDHVFRAPAGGRWDERNFERGWDRLRGRFTDAGVRPFVFHSLRHTFATLALGAGATIKQVQLWLGHASPEITLRVYAHAIPEAAPRGFLEAADQRGVATTGRPEASIPTPRP